jgi:DNA replication protein DnaC
MNLAPPTWFGTSLEFPRASILDEVGHHALSVPASRAFCQLLTHRYTRGSLVLTSNRGLDTWQQFLGDEVLAAAVLDRFLHHATVFSQTGESYRLKDAKRRRGRS